jgi:hypothetical protein
MTWQATVGTSPYPRRQRRTFGRLARPHRCPVSDAGPAAMGQKRHGPSGRVTWSDLAALGRGRNGQSRALELAVTDRRPATRCACPDRRQVPHGRATPVLLQMLVLQRSRRDFAMLEATLARSRRAGMPSAAKRTSLICWTWSANYIEFLAGGLSTTDIRGNKEPTRRIS